MFKHYLIRIYDCLLIRFDETTVKVRAARLRKGFNGLIKSPEGSTGSANRYSLRGKQGERHATSVLGG